MLVPTRKPRMNPITSSMRMAQACLARSARIRPASGANRAIGSERSRELYGRAGQFTHRVRIVTPPRGRPPARAATRTQKCDHMLSWISLASRSRL
jgi:hypothetical protein